MLRRVRQLNISLAAKCQLLFGVAVVLIIAAALVVPWLRMERLMEQIDERASRVVAERFIDEHVLHSDGGKRNPTTQATPTTQQISSTQPMSTALLAPTTDPTLTTQPVPIPEAAPVAGRMGYTLLPPRLQGVRRLYEADALTRFEQRAFSAFSVKPDRDFFFRRYTRDNGEARYRFALALQVQESCLSCHSASALRSPASTSNPTSARASFVDAVPSDLLGLISVDLPSYGDTRQQLLNRVFIFAAGLLAGTLAILVFYLITTRLILEPVRVLQETAEKVSEGDLNIRSDINTGDEFQQLSETFNTMLTNLKSSADQLRAINKSLDLRLGQLAESNVALYESNRLKNEFLANVSHELRTPLNSILGFAELLKDALNSPEPKTQRYLTNILSSGRNLLELINDLLDLAKIEAGRMEVRSEPLSVNDLFEGLSNVLKPLVAPKNVTIRSQIESGVPIIETDAAKLQQILYNFLSNAIKFSPTNALIDLSADVEDESHIRIRVRDHGPGISPDKHHVIFEKFRQIDGSVTREHSGTGLGLAISRELTTLMGGTIGVDSNPGEGSTFWVVIPIKIKASTADLRGKMVLV